MDETGDIQAIPKERHSWTSGIWLVLRMGFKNGDLKERDKEKCNIQFKIKVKVNSTNMNHIYTI